MNRSEEEVWKMTPRKLKMLTNVHMEINKRSSDTKEEPEYDTIEWEGNQVVPIDLLF